MSRISSIENEIREFLGKIAGVEIVEEALVGFLTKLPAQIEETYIGVYENDKEIGVIKVSYSGNPCDGIRKWCVRIMKK